MHKFGFPLNTFFPVLVAATLGEKARFEFDDPIDKESKDHDWLVKCSLQINHPVTAL